MKKFVLGAEDRFEDRFFSWNEIFHQGLRDRILRQEQGCETGDMRSGKSMVLERLNSFKSDTINRMLYTDLKISLPNDMLAKVDLMSMKNSLEVRVPFLDHRLVEYVFRLPGRLKLPGKKGKFILLEAFKYLLPPALLAEIRPAFPDQGVSLQGANRKTGDLQFRADRRIDRGSRFQPRRYILAFMEPDRFPGLALAIFRLLSCSKE
jgi:asparagine synthetase B (glutamine-hydrolysing)